MCETIHFDVKGFCEAINTEFGSHPLIPKGFVEAEAYDDHSFNLRIGPRDVTFDCAGNETAAGTVVTGEWMIVPCMPHIPGKPLPPEIEGGPK